MPRKPEILEACQDYGLVLGKTLIEYAGWKVRGSDSFDPKGSVNHHTAGARVGDLPSIQTLVNGRSDLPGPLCNGAESRSGVIHLIAAGKANHAGLGSWKGLTGNSSVWGLEVEHYGYPDEPVSDKQWDTMYRWHAACMDVSGKSDASLVCQHFEWAPLRKIDFVKTLIATQGGVEGFRSKVAAKNPGDDMAFTEEEENLIVNAARLISNGAPGFGVASWSQIALSIDGINMGTPGEAGYREALRTFIAKQDLDVLAAIAGIPAKVVAALPPSSGGGGITPEQVEAACEEAIKDSGLLGLLPGQ